MDSIRIIRIMDKLQKLVILVKNAETIMVLKENVDSHIQKLNKTVITMESKTTITTIIIIMVDSKIKEHADSEKNVKTSMVLKENVDLNIRNINKILINPIIIIIQIICLVVGIQITITIITCLAEVVIKIMGIKIMEIKVETKELVDLEKNVKTSMVLKENVDSHIQNINKTKPKETITIMVEC